MAEDSSLVGRMKAAWQRDQAEVRELNDRADKNDARLADQARGFVRKVQGRVNAYRSKGRHTARRSSSRSR